MSGVREVAKKAFLIVRRRTTPVHTTQPGPTQTMRGHKRSVWAVAFFKDGRRVVSGSDDKTLRIWDVEKGELVGEPLEGHNDWVKSVAVSPDNRRIASGGDDKTIIIWDVESKQKAFDPLVKHMGTVWSVCFSPDGKTLASGSGDETVIIWDAETGVVLFTLQGHRDAVWSVAFSPDGLKLASGSCDHTIRVWRTDNAEQLLNIDDAHRDWVQSVLWSPDGQQLVSASADATVRFWNSSDGHQIGEPCTGHTSKIVSLAISSDGSFIATASLDLTVRLWSTNSHQQIGEALKHTAWVWVYCVAISPGGELLVSGDYVGEVQLWSMENTLSAATQLYPSRESYFAHRSKVKLGHSLYLGALSDAEKVIELNPLSHLGYELKRAALHGAQRYDDALEALQIMLSKLDDAADPEIQKLRQRYIGPSIVEAAVRRAIHAHLENAPLHLINTLTGRLCNREAQIDAFIESSEYKELLYSSVMHPPLQTQPIKEAVAKYFSWVMLSHRWESKELRLHDIQDKVIYNLVPVGTVVKLQKFCEVVSNAGYCWAWSDTCCIDQNNNAEVQRSVNSMFVWYRHSALTIIYLSDVPPFSQSGALAKSIWNTRGWTVQEFLAPNVVLFYQADWTLYLGICSRNHKESVAIMQELEHSTGIDVHSLVTFNPGMTGAREKLQWASSRVTTLQEDIAYSLFGIFGIHLPVIYGEMKQNALGRLLQEVVAKSGDITALDWVGQSSNFNSCLPADIVSYKAPPSTQPTLSEDEIQKSVSILRHTVTVESTLKLSTLLVNLSVPRFANSRLQLPCITFPVTEVRRRPGQDQETNVTYQVKADGLHDLPITTEDKLAQFSPAWPTRQTFLLVRPWNRYLLEPDFADDASMEDYWSAPGSPLQDSPPGSPREQGPVDSESSELALRLIVRLGQPFSAFLLAQQRGGEYKRIASDHYIIAQVTDVASVRSLMDVRTLEIL